MSSSSIKKKKHLCNNPQKMTHLDPGCQVMSPGHSRCINTASRGRHRYRPRPLAFSLLTADTWLHWMWVLRRVKSKSKLQSLPLSCLHWIQYTDAHFWHSLRARVCRHDKWSEWTFTLMRLVKQLVRMLYRYQKDPSVRNKWIVQSWHLSEDFSMVMDMTVLMNLDLAE